MLHLVFNQTCPLFWSANNSALDSSPTRTLFRKSCTFVYVPSNQPSGLPVFLLCTSPIKANF